MATGETVPKQRMPSVAARILDPGLWANWAIFLALGGILIAGGLLSPDFLTSGNIESILVAASILVVLAVGQTFVILTAGIDLSIGSLTQLSGVLVGVAVTHKWGIGFGVVLAIALGAAMGMVNGLVITRGRINDFIVTLGTLSVASGIALVLSNAQPVTIIDSGMIALATGTLGPLRWIVVVALVVVVFGHIALFHTRLGTHVLAVGGNREASRDMGIAVDRIKVTAYAFSGLLAGLGGVMLTARIGAAEPSAGSDYLLNSVAATVLGGVSLFGGRGTIIGPVVGALVLTAILNLMNILGVGVFYQPIVIGTVIVLSALLYRYQRS
jgi:ribose transport system permease protein